MPKLGEVILSLSGKAGIKKEDETLKKLLALQEVSMFDLPDELANALERNLLTQDSAAANPDVRSKIMAEALNGVDSRLATILNDFEFDDAFKGEVNGIKNTYEKLNKVAAGLKDQLKVAKEKSKQSGDPKDKQEVETLKKEIENYNSQITNLKRSHEIEIENERTKALNDKVDFTERSKLAMKPLPKNGLDLEINILSAQNLLKRDAAKHGLIVKFDEVGNPTLKQRKDGAEIDFFVDNKKVDYDSWVDGVLASNKFIQINDQQQQQQGTGNNGSYQAQPGAPTNTAIAAESAAKLAQLGIGAQV